MSAEQNMALARRLMEARVKGDGRRGRDVAAPTSSATPDCLTKRLTAKAQMGGCPARCRLL